MSPLGCSQGPNGSPLKFVSISNWQAGSAATRHAAAPSINFLASEFPQWSEISQFWDQIKIEQTRVRVFPLWLGPTLPFVQVYLAYDPDGSISSDRTFNILLSHILKLSLQLNLLYVALVNFVFPHRGLVTRLMSSIERNSCHEERSR